jgi:hypothetical protein
MTLNSATQNAATTLLDNAGTLGPGTPSGYLQAPDGTVQAFSTFTVAVSLSLGVSNYSVEVEGSLDGGTSWFPVGLVHQVSGLFTVTGPAVIQIRGNLVQISGTSPTVTVVAIGVS